MTWIWASTQLEGFYKPLNQLKEKNCYFASTEAMNFKVQPANVARRSSYQATIPRYLEGATALVPNF